MVALWYYLHMGIREFEQQLYVLSKSGKVIFTQSELLLLLPERSPEALRTALSRYVSNGVLIHLVSGIYLNPRSNPSVTEVLYTCAGILRSKVLWYLSLESALSEHGLISQIPINTITCMTKGRSGRFPLSGFGTVEFTHTKKVPEELLPHLRYDAARGCYIADSELALKDLKATGRNLDLLLPEASS